MFKSLLPAVGLAMLATTAAAHVSFEQAEAAQGETVRFTLRIPHGCDGQPTLKLSVRIPEGLVAVKPMPKPGWALQTVTGKYARSYSTGRAEVTEGVTEITWTGELPDAWYDEFVFRATITDTFAAGSVLYVPVVQECAGGRESWTDIPAAGQDAHDLPMPAPGVRINAGGHSHH